MWYAAGDSNPHALRRQDLNLLRLPISPAAQHHIQPINGKISGNEST